MPQIAPELVILDCDGVLVDSEPISVAVLLELIEAAGGTVSEEQAYRLFLGRSMASVRDVLQSDFGLTLTLSSSTACAPNSPDGSAVS